MILCDAHHGTFQVPLIIVFELNKNRSHNDMLGKQIVGIVYLFNRPITAVRSGFDERHICGRDKRRNNDHPMSLRARLPNRNNTST